MRTWLPIGLLGVVALGGLIAGVRSTGQKPVEAALSRPEPSTTSTPPVRPPEPPPPPLAELAVRAREKQWPAPPVIGKVTDREIHDYVEKVKTLAKGQDRETAVLAHDLVRRVQQDAHEWEKQNRRRDFMKRQDELKREHEAVREAHEKNRPASVPKPADPTRVPPPSPLEGPPVSGVEPPPEKKK